MYVSHLSLHDYRSYASAEVALEPGVTAFLGRNGQGKTNLVEAIDYLSRLASHRVATDAPLVRAGAERAVVRAAVVKDGRQAVLEVEVNPGRANRARVNRATLPRAREIVGLVRTVLFAPDDLALVKGDPSERRRFLDDLLVLRVPRLAGTRADYERVLKQRNSLLKTAGIARGSAREGALATLTVWDEQLARHGADLLAARLRLVEELRPLVGAAYATVARGATRDDARLSYRSSVPLPGEPETDLDDPAGPTPAPSVDAPVDAPVPVPADSTGDDSTADSAMASRTGTATDPTTGERATPEANELAVAILAEVERRRRDELDRGVSLVGPHRDDLLCALGDLPVKGYASHGESWSFALALRLASYDLLRRDGDDPILILDDVFAELDADRRAALADLVAGAEQVLVTAAVAEDVPAVLAGARFRVAGGEVTPDAG